jgi:hypothetical protein
MFSQQHCMKGGVVFGGIGIHHRANPLDFK